MIKPISSVLTSHPSISQKSGAFSHVNYFAQSSIDKKHEESEGFCQCCIENIKAIFTCIKEMILSFFQCLGCCKESKMDLPPIKAELIKKTFDNWVKEVYLIAYEQDGNAMIPNFENCVARIWVHRGPIMDFDRIFFPQFNECSEIQEMGNIWGELKGPSQFKACLIGQNADGTFSYFYRTYDLNGVRKNGKLDYDHHRFTKKFPKDAKNLAAALIEDLKDPEIVSKLIVQNDGVWEIPPPFKLNIID